MNFRDEMKEKVGAGYTNKATSYHNQCMVNYESDIKNACDQIVEIIKTGIKEAKVNEKYYKKTLWFVNEKHRKNMAFSQKIGLQQITKYEKRVCVYRNRNNTPVLVADIGAIRRIFSTICSFCKQNEIWNIALECYENNCPQIKYIDENWTCANGKESSGFEYMTDINDAPDYSRPWLMKFHVMILI